MKKMILGLFMFISLIAVYAHAADQLTATIIGSGSPIYNENRASASTLISAGNTHILVDMGNGTQANLSKLGFDIRDLSSLFITHHHLDHNEEFVPILIRLLLGKNDFTIVGPPNTKKLTETNLDLYEADIAYRLGKTQRTLADRIKAFDVTDIQGGESFKVGDIQVTTLQVPHTIHTVAYRFDYNGQSIVITGDLTYSETLPTLARNADYMIIDSGGMVMIGGRNKNTNKGAKIDNKNGSNKKTRAHLNLNDSSTLAQKANVKNLVYTHFTAGIVDEEASLKEIRKNYSGNVIFGKDLMVVNTEAKPSLTTTSQKVASYSIVDTGQRISYNNNAVILLPDNANTFFGQDANYSTNPPSYSDNNDGTITDNVTGLIWQKQMGEKLSYEQALLKINSFKLAGNGDWRIPSIKELYSLIQFSGSVKGQKALTPFIDTSFFNQPLGNTKAGEREIDAQTWSNTEYVGKTMKNDDTVFGVNFVDGRIKGYPKFNPRTKDPNKMYFRFVRGNEAYGKNNFVDNNDGTITDLATGLTWQQADSNKGLNWQDALQYSENLTLAGQSDWRLPDAKELQSIVDYTRSPETTHSAAIDPIFYTSSIINEAGEKDYPYYWSSTTHLDGPVPESGAVYVAFGKALGEMNGNIMDVHGAGSQRSDPKTGKPISRGPQGDYIRVENYVRSVRGGNVVLAAPINTQPQTEKVSEYTTRTDNQTRLTIETQNNKNSTQSNKFINRFDKNDDGKVSASEFKAGTKRFNHFDKNKDGYITANEAPTGPPKNTK
ncbi:DUF1566 domain-containing protein [Shewanella sp. MEBiC00475]|uniref:Lcl domain-containing protein n=1 Tax=Shewanella sp. MEBiC00475 TaxID=2575361 RepID=UPI001C3103E2|nr:DUF1566 domain-containing protein [Shewanella sp. MEBiC00475]